MQKSLPAVKKLRSEIVRISYVEDMADISEREYYRKVKSYYQQILDNDYEKLKKDLRNA